MPQDRAASAYRAEFMRRVKIARKLRFRSQEALAKVLGMKQDKYKHYEGGKAGGNRQTLMPHDLIERFCKACGVDANWLVTGQGVGPPWKDAPVQRRAHKQHSGTTRRPSLQA